MSIEIRENALYTPHEVAGILSLSLQTVQRMLKVGTLPGFRIGKRRWYVRGGDLLAMAGNDSDAAAKLAGEGGQGDAD